jgi:excisionase family DNA binding protein
MAKLDGYFTPAEAAPHFGVSVGTVYRWCKNAELDCVRVGRYWFIPKDELERVLDPPRPSNDLYTKPALTITEAARLLHIKRRTLERWVARGKVPTVRSGRLHTITRRTINALMEELQERYQA